VKSVIEKKSNCPTIGKAPFALSVSSRTICRIRGIAVSHAIVRNTTSPAKIPRKMYIGRLNTRLITNAYAV